MISYPRLLERILQSEASQDKVRLLFGARQTGKSTLLQRIANANAKVFNLHERRTRLELERDPHVFTQILEADNINPSVVCVDEIQKVPALLDEVQYLYDTYPGRLRFLLTGSSARKLKTSSANFLPGRAYRLSFWRTAHGAEVDYVLETPDEVIPIGVKATESPTLADASHLKLFLETYPQRAERGFIVCRCREPRRLAENIEAVPWKSL